MMKVSFFETQPWERRYLEKKIRSLSLRVESQFVRGVVDKDHLPEKKGFEILSVFVNSTLKEAVLRNFPRLKFIATRSTGFDHIDLEFCQKKKIFVSNVPSYGENTVAEYVFGLILSLSRKVHQANDQIRQTGSWDLAAFQGFDLKGKTLGVVGVGNIGTNVIRIARGFGMRVLAFTRHPDENLALELGFEYVPWEKLLKRSDIVTLHVPYTPQTHHLINEKALALMKKGAILINTSRGAVVETEALVKFLQSGYLGGAGLDVLEEEGPTKDEASFLISGHPEEHNLRTILQNHVLLDLPNVIITPHNAFNTKEALERILETTVSNIVAFREGQPINLVK